MQGKLRKTNVQTNDKEQELLPVVLAGRDQELAGENGDPGILKTPRQSDPTMCTWLGSECCDHLAQGKPRQKGDHKF